LKFVSKPFYESVDFFEITDEQWQRLFDINIMSGIRLSRHYLQKMLQRARGRILFISSESAIAPAPEMAHYSATKTMQLSIARKKESLDELVSQDSNKIIPVEDVYPGVEAQQTIEQVKSNRKALEKQFASRLPTS
jgi:3-oxoacyl-[acyl-carrier protein] reductase